MNSIKQFFSSYIRDEEGASASEYAVLVALIVVAVSAAVAAFDIDQIYLAVNGIVNGCVTGPTC